MVFKYQMPNTKYPVPSTQYPVAKTTGHAPDSEKILQDRHRDDFSAEMPGLQNLH